MKEAVYSLVAWDMQGRSEPTVIRLDGPARLIYDQVWYDKGGKQPTLAAYYRHGAAEDGHEDGWVLAFDFGGGGPYSDLEIRAKGDL